MSGKLPTTWREPVSRLITCTRGCCPDACDMKAMSCVAGE